MDIRMIALDLDGTVLNGRKEIDEPTLEALQEASRAGVTVVAATGRAFGALPEALFSIPAFRYAVTSNGSSIYQLPGKERIYFNPMTRRNLSDLLALLAEYPVPAEVFADGAAYAPRAYTENPSSFGVPARAVTYIRTTRTPVEDIRAFIQENAGRIEGVNLIAADMEQKKEIRRAAGQISNLYITSSVPHYLEFAAETVSKETALAHLCSLLHIPGSQVMACGDGENDLEMLRFAGLGVAMDNAAPLLKKAADYITSSNNEQGVANAVRKFVLSP